MKKIIVSILLTLLATPVFAASSPYNAYGATKYYLGVSGGRSSLDTSTTTVSATSFTFLGGYSINDNFAAELGYSNFGNMDLGSNQILKSNAFSLGVAANLPITESVSLFGKLGYASTTYVVENNGVAGTTNSSGNAMTAVGATYQLNKKTDIRASYNTYKLVDATTNAISNLTDMNIGILFKF